MSLHCVSRFIPLTSCLIQCVCNSTIVMKYNYIYVAFVVIVKLLWWRQRCIEYWIRLVYWYRRNRDYRKLQRCGYIIQSNNRTMTGKNTKSVSMYTFRPFEIQKINYKTYSSTYTRGRGINSYPKPRSGHRIVVNDTDIFCFGGKFIVRTIFRIYYTNEPMRHIHLDIGY